MMVDIVSRVDWGANPVNCPAGLITEPAPELWLHHTGSPGLHGASGMRSIQAGAIAQGYVDIEYTYIADTDGKTYVARGPGRNSAATKDHNGISQAICAFGNFVTQQPTDALLDAIAQLVVKLHADGHIQTPRINGPHKDVFPTACCGTNLIARIDDINDVAGQAKPEPKPTPSGGGAVDICSTPGSGTGYWIVDSVGAVFSFGDAKYHGGANGKKLNAPIVSMAARPQNDGYWLVASDGGVFAYGNAPYKGSMGGKKLNKPVVAITAADDGKGYWLVAADGGVFAFGSAPFKGAATGMVH